MHVDACRCMADARTFALLCVCVCVCVRQYLASSCDSSCTTRALALVSSCACVLDTSSALALCALAMSSLPCEVTHTHTHAHVTVRGVIHPRGSSRAKNGGSGTDVRHTGQGRYPKEQSDGHVCKGRSRQSNVVRSIPWLSLASAVGL